MAIKQSGGRQKQKANQIKSKRRNQRGGEWRISHYQLGRRGPRDVEEWRRELEQVEIELLSSPSSHSTVGALSQCCFSECSTREVCGAAPPFSIMGGGSRAARWARGQVGGVGGAQVGAPEHHSHQL